MQTLEGLRRKKCIALFLPEHADETALIEVKVPLPTPRSPEEIREEFPFNRLAAGVRLRYAGKGEAEGNEGPSAGRGDGLERVIDLYFNIVGFKMNNFILDELRLLCQRFSRDEVEKAFARAKKNDIRSLSWIAKDLYRSSSRRRGGAKPRQTKEL
jgi:hypothetical protein